MQLLSSIFHMLNIRMGQHYVPVLVKKLLNVSNAAPIITRNRQMKDPYRPIYCTPSYYQARRELSI